jgi:hypothetical protein
MEPVEVHALFPSGRGASRQGSSPIALKTAGSGLQSIGNRRKTPPARRNTPERC